MMFKAISPILVAATASLFTMMSAQAALVGRDINRNAVAANDSSAVYLWDQDLGITWLRDANVNGAQDWDTQVAWAQNLVTGAGATTINDWRLPTVTAPTGSGPFALNYAGGPGVVYGFNVDTSLSEMAHLYYVTLGNLAAYDTSGAFRGGNSGSGWGLVNAGDFLNFQSYRYWSGTEYGPNSNSVWNFCSSSGCQDDAAKDLLLYAMAVRDGDVLAAQVPEPESLLLTLTAMGTMALVRRRKK